MTTTTRLRVRVQPLGYEDLTFNHLSSRVATVCSFSNPFGWEHGFVTYLGFSSKASAQVCMKHLLRAQLASDVDLRPGKRLKGSRWELKVRGLHPNTVLNLTLRDLNN